MLDGRGAAAGSEALRGTKREYVGGRYVYRRCRFHTDKQSLRGHHTPLTFEERLRLERWARSAE